MEIDFDNDKWRVLVVDDVQVHRFIVGSGLKRLNPYLKVTEAAGVEEAISLLSESGNRFDIVISDWNMPGAGGEELLRWMRKRPAFKRVPFLMISGNTDNEDIIKAFMELGVDAYVTKPFTPDDLYAKAKQALQKAGVA